MSTWVLLRGLMREARHWGKFPETLRSAMPDAEPVLLDLPGNGSLHAMQSPTRIEEMAAFCRDALRAKGYAPPYHLLALSLGAMVAGAWSVRYPDEIAGCVLINTSLRPFSPFYQRLHPRNYASLIRMCLHGHDMQLREQLILRATSRDGTQADVLREWVSYGRENPVSTRNALRQLLAAIRYRAPQQAPQVPMLLLRSAQDRLVDPRCSCRLADQWKLPLATHPTAGHDLALDDGMWIAEQVRQWRHLLSKKTPHR